MSARFDSNRLNSFLPWFYEYGKLARNRYSLIWQYRSMWRRRVSHRALIGIRLTTSSCFRGVI